jgi:hypothetical protein
MERTSFRLQITGAKTANQNLTLTFRQIRTSPICSKKTVSLLCIVRIFAADDSVCGDIEDEFRFRDGYIMQRDETPLAHLRPRSTAHPPVVGIFGFGRLILATDQARPMTDPAIQKP